MVAYGNIVFPYPFNPRISHGSSTMTYDPDKQILQVIGKPYVFNDLQFNVPVQMEICPKKGSEMKKSKVYPFFDYYVLSYQQIDEEKVLFSQVKFWIFLTNFFWRWSK